MRKKNNVSPTGENQGEPQRANQVRSKATHQGEAKPNQVRNDVTNEVSHVVANQDPVPINEVPMIISSIKSAAEGLVKKEIDHQIGSLISQRQVLREHADQIKEAIGDVWYTVGFKALEELYNRDPSSMTTKELTTLADTATENARLLEGKPTEIIAQYKLVVEKYLVKPEV
ncbi:MAG: hypothetical protein ABIL14_01470 [candidate division WOR-3 bacterium]